MPLQSFCLKTKEYFLNNFLGIEEKYSNYKNAQAIILPVPYEQTTSYGSGTKFGPEAILKASAYVELYDEEFDNDIYLQGIHTTEHIDVNPALEDVFENITSAFKTVLNDRRFPVGLGGEHSISYPVYRAFHSSYENISVLQLDAHSDLRDSYEGSVYSHASVMRRIYNLNPNIVQVGIRSQCREEAEFIREKQISTYYAHQLSKKGFGDQIIDQLKENVFITIDVDFFDPSIMPSTGTPEPGGFLWYETLDFLNRVFLACNVVGFDVVELAPQPNIVHPDFLCAKLVYKLLNYKFGR